MYVSTYIDTQHTCMYRGRDFEQECIRSSDRKAKLMIIHEKYDQLDFSI